MGKKVNEAIMREAVSSLADFLMNWGFEPKKAFEASEDFWKKHKNKIGEIYG